MLLGLTALTWIILIPATMCWPVAGIFVYLLWRWSKKHEEHAEAERERLLEAAAVRTAPGPGGPAS
jgi:heme/copper-type cytochrome/quinol oxidase subunit 2